MTLSTELMTLSGAHLTATSRGPSVGTMVDLKITPAELELLTEALEGHASELEATDEEFAELHDKLIAAAGTSLGRG